MEKKEDCNVMWIVGRRGTELLSLEVPPRGVLGALREQGSGAGER